VRHDRDEFISINMDNIDPNRRTDFDKRSFGVAGDHPVGGVDTHHTPYDLLCQKVRREREWSRTKLKMYKISNL